MMTTNEMVGCIATYMLILIMAWTLKERKYHKEQEKHQCDDDYMDHTKDA